MRLITLPDRLLTLTSSPTLCWIVEQFRRQVKIQIEPSALTPWIGVPPKATPDQTIAAGRTVDPFGGGAFGWVPWV
jgi:hypothetical protein